MLLDNGVDIVNVADAPRAMARMSNLAFCSLLLERHGIQPILHVCGRDRNLLGQMAHLLGAHAIGIRNLVIITGDPPKVGDYPEATAVYDLDAIGLLQMASSMNRGIDPAGKPLPGGKTSFLLATGLEPGAADLDKEIRRLEQKKAAGAELVMTQPVLQTDLLEEVLRRIECLEHRTAERPSVSRHQRPRQAAVPFRRCCNIDRIVEPAPVLVPPQRMVL